MANKSLRTTYLLWLFGGLFGAHHLYLERDFQALIWILLPGGYAGIGFILDLWQIEDYVKYANEERSYMEQLAEKMQQHKRPPLNTVRIYGELAVADAFGYLVMRAIPRELFPETHIPLINSICAPFASALGIYVTGNIGVHEGSFGSALFGAYLTSPLYFYFNSPVFVTSAASADWFNLQSRKWRRARKPKKSLPRRLAFFSLCGFIYLSLWSSWWYFNCAMASQGIEPVKCKHAVKHFSKSPIRKEPIFVLKDIWHNFREYGIQEGWNIFIKAFDPTGEKNALKVLGLNDSSTLQEIKARYIILSQEWHPDSYKNSKQKQSAKENHSKVQEAYAILSTFQTDRLSQYCPFAEQYEDHPDEMSDLLLEILDCK
ncbi:dnaJ subfamily C member 22 [Nephila pilipes]|uniref:DnaJ homolog subfamily C member 22 n=1 Tax=Nephila pilipes TaxID=299642 RepID=A0A8X6PGB7_NEPPI|nr:dnaJ subfamily C member 22 [Nephila pilipes]